MPPAIHIHVIAEINVAGGVDIPKSKAPPYLAKIGEIRMGHSSGSNSALTG
jgi:hypothetical protein